MSAISACKKVGDPHSGVPEKGSPALALAFFQGQDQGAYTVHISPLTPAVRPHAGVDCHVPIGARKGSSYGPRAGLV